MWQCYPCGMGLAALLYPLTSRWYLKPQPGCIAGWPLPNHKQPPPLTKPCLPAHMHPPLSLALVSSANIWYALRALGSLGASTLDSLAAFGAFGAFGALGPLSLGLAVAVLAVMVLVPAAGLTVLAVRGARFFATAPGKGGRRKHILCVGVVFRLQQQERPCRVENGWHGWERLSRGAPL